MLLLHTHRVKNPLISITNQARAVVYPLLKDYRQQLLQIMISNVKMLRWVLLSKGSMKITETLCCNFRLLRSCAGTFCADEKCKVRSVRLTWVRVTDHLSERNVNSVKTSCQSLVTERSEPRIKELCFSWLCSVILYNKHAAAAQVNNTQANFCPL